MARDPSFAPPLSSLATPTLGPPGVAVYPSAGQGLSLNERGIVPASALGNREIVMVKFESNVTVSATTAATGNQVVSSGALDYDGQPICVEFFAPRGLTGNNSNLICNLWDGTTQKGRIAQIGVASAATTNTSGQLNGFIHITPTPGPHTFLVKAWRDNANGTINAGSGGDDPAFVPGFIRIYGVVK